MIYSNCGKTDDPKGYNQRNLEYRYSSKFSGGCVGVRACENCGTINGGTCMCIGIFTCCECGFKNGENIPWLNNNISINTPKIGFSIYNE